MILAVIFSVISVLPADRLALADRLFNRGQYEKAALEYKTLVSTEGIPAGEVEFRLGECHRALGRTESARQHYLSSLASDGNSRYAPQARLYAALCAPSGAVKVSELKHLDADDVPASVRAAACYHLGVATPDDTDYFTRSVEIDPKGSYAPYALFARASVWVKSKDENLRKKAVGDLLTVAFGKDKALGDDALYVAAVESYTWKKYSQASTMLRRYARNFPQGRHAEEALRLRAWSDYLSEKYAECSAVCATGKGEDFDYLAAACAYQGGDNEKARVLFAKYLEAYPDGRYRANCELPLARLGFDAAREKNDSVSALENARRAYSISHLSDDAMRLAWWYEKESKIDEARRIYDEIASSNPGTPAAGEALFRKAMIDVRAGNWSGAELSLAEAMKTKGEFPLMNEARYWRGMAAISIGHDAEGARFLAQSLEGPLSLDQKREARIALADIAYGAGDFAAARKAYSELVSDGATDRMSAKKTLFVGKFLLSDKGGTPAPLQVKACAKAIEQSKPGEEWMQQAKILEGAAEEAAGHFTAAAAAYRAAFAYKCRTESSAAASVALGILERKAGRLKEASAILREAVELNSADVALRCKAYVELAETALALGDVSSARGYATVVTTLFNDPECTARAEKLLKENPEVVK